MPRPLPILAGLVALLLPSAARAWDDHTPATRLAFAGVPAVAQAAPVVAEPLEAFLAAEQVRLSEVLAGEEAWARTSLPAWPPRPEALAFAAQGEAVDIVPRFLAAIRMNPDARLPLYAALEPGALVAPLDVLATAATEPDSGLDIGLFEDNGTVAGQRYGFGIQPFGDPRLDYGSQAPFHMGFYQEARIVYLLAGFLERSWPDARIHLTTALAREAFATGHDYWGWRFTGWALHYVQDLVQPYHARVLPGVSVVRMLWINTLAVIGFPRAKDDAVRLVSDRHLALEAFVHDALAREVRDGHGPLTTALGPGRLDPTRPFRQASIRGELTEESAGRSREADQAVAAGLMAGEPAATERLAALAERLMGSFGTWSRAYVASVRGAGLDG
jgi:hypothetical protein